MAFKAAALQSYLCKGVVFCLCWVVYKRVFYHGLVALPGADKRSIAKWSVFFRYFVPLVNVVLAVTQVQNMIYISAHIIHAWKPDSISVGVKHPTGSSQQCTVATEQEKNSFVAVKSLVDVISLVDVNSLVITATVFPQSGLMRGLTA